MTRSGTGLLACPAYVELHARSAFSFLEGSCIPEDLAGACASLDMPAMALLDRNGVYGSPRFHMAAKKAGVRAHIGSEITCTNGRTYPLLAASREGYRNLCRLVTRMKLRAPKGEGAATLEEFAEFSRGLICLTAHPDERLLDIFGKHALCAELQRHHNREEEAHNQEVIERARRLGIPLVATIIPPTLFPRSANCWMFSPASAIKLRWPPRAGCWNATASDTSNRPPK